VQRASTWLGVTSIIKSSPVVLVSQGQRGVNGESAALTRKRTRAHLREEAAFASIRMLEPSLTAADSTREFMLPRPQLRSPCPGAVRRSCGRACVRACVRPCVRAWRWLCVAPGRERSLANQVMTDQSEFFMLNPIPLVSLTFKVRPIF
jgi:hypothetical protein